MKKSAIALFFAAFLSMVAFGQNVQEGVNHLYAKRNASARAVFEKLLASNPNNIEASYWLGQTHLSVNNLAGARQVYEKALAASNNAPLILVGLGHVELLEGKSAEARQRFESALTASRGRKGDDPNILNAVGRANVNAYSEAKKLGDLDYAIAKLNAAAQAAPTNADIHLNLGNAYRKKHQGGDAVRAYRRAAEINPSMAVAHYRTAQLYQTQRTNREVVMENLNNAIKADPRFFPAYEEQYRYAVFFDKDFNQASQLADKIISNSDPSVTNDYYKYQINFLQKNYDAAIAGGKDIINKAGAETTPNVYRLVAYSMLEKGDTSGAAPYVDQLFARATEEDILGQDYILRGVVHSKNNPNAMIEAYRMAIQEDSVLANQFKLLDEAIAEFGKTNRTFEGDMRLLKFQLKGANANPAELVSIGVPYYYGRQYQRADSLFGAYSTAFPDSIYGHMWSARAREQMDTTMSLGLAVPAYEQLLRVSETDKVRFKSYGLLASSRLAVYYANVKNDREKGVQYLTKALEFDPTNEGLKSNLEKLKKTPAARPATPGTNQKTTTPAKPPVKTGETKVKVTNANGGQTKTKTESGKTKVKKS